MLWAYQSYYCLKELTLGINDFCLFSISLILFFYDFLPFSLGLICSSFASILRLSTWIVEVSPPFILIHTFGDVTLPLVTAFAVFHNF